MVPEAGNYRILEVKNTQGKSSKVSFQSMADTSSDPVVAYAYQVAHTLEKDVEGFAAFEMSTPDPKKPSDRGYLKVKLWTPIGGVKPPTGHLGSKMTVPNRNSNRISNGNSNGGEIFLDQRDKTIIAQSSGDRAASMITTGIVMVEGNTVDDAVLVFEELASKIAQATVRVAQGLQ